MRRVIVSVLVALTAVATWSVAAPTPAFAAGESWTPRTTPQSTWRSVATDGAGVWVAVADSGADRIMISEDNGENWTAQTAPVVNTWTSVTYGEGLFVAVASDAGANRVMTNADPTTDPWTANTAPAGAWSSVVYNADDDLWVAVATSGSNRVMTTKDAEGTWTAVADAVADAGSWTSVTYGAGIANVFVAVGTDGKIMTSPRNDGTVWGTSPGPGGQTTNSWTSVAYGGGRFVAVSSNGTDRAMYSDDGVAWYGSGDTAATGNGAWTSVIFHSGDTGLFVAVGSGTSRVMTSEDGIDWNTRTAPSNSWSALATDGDDLVAVASAGSLRVMTASDPIGTWTAGPAAVNSWTAVTYGDGLFVAVAGDGSINRVMTSPDGVTWTGRAAAAENPWTSVVYGPTDDRFVAVASDGTNRVMTSTDGINWAPAIAAADQTWTSVTYGEGKFVAVSSDGGTAGVMTSIDGVNWTLSADVDTNDGDWTSVTYGNSTFVAVSSDGLFITSGDGVLWSAATDAPGTSTWRSVTYGAAFVAVADAGAAGEWAMTSANGTAWTLSSDLDTDNALWTSVTYGDATYVAVADANTAANRVMNSTNGTAWIAQGDTDALDGDWSSVAFSSGIFVAVAYEGTSRIMTSGTFTPAVGVPTITSFDPTEGPVGTEVTITGTNFVDGDTTVFFNGTEVPAEDVTVNSPTSITVLVPEGATTGPIRVTTGNGTVLSDDDFTVTVVSDAIRIWGQDEVDTAIEVAQEAFPVDGSASAVVLARSDFFADALAGGPLAADVNGPLLLTYGAPTDRGDSLPTKVRSEIDRLLSPGDTVYILGGPLAISSEVEADVDAAGYNVVRIGRANQFGTAVAIAEEIGSPGAIFEATGWNFPDALSAVPAAIDQNGVIVLTNDNVQAPETQAYIDANPGVSRFTIGGVLVAGGADSGATNVSGDDLYETSAAVAKKWFVGPNEFGVATGNNFPDALSGGVFMATGGRLGPMLLVNGTALPVPPSIEAYLNGLDPGTTGYFFGGTIAISTSVLNAVMAAVGA